jgi:hypothetical protein
VSGSNVASDVEKFWRAFAEGGKVAVMEARSKASEAAATAH